MITLERWKNFSKRDQLGHIASEIWRARLVEEKNKETFLQILERIIYLIDLSLNDPKWRDNPLPLLYLRQEISKAYLGEKDKLEILSKAL